MQTGMQLYLKYLKGEKTFLVRERSGTEKGEGGVVVSTKNYTKRLAAQMGSATMIHLLYCVWDAFFKKDRQRGREEGSLAGVSCITVYSRGGRF